MVIKDSKKIFTFGEIMLRISPALTGERIAEAKNFIVEPGGSESNVAIALSLLGNPCAFVTKLPETTLTDKIIKYLKSYSIDTTYLVCRGEYLGLYWTEIGIGLRPYQVFYDRRYSSFSEINYEDFDWKRIFKNINWFHVSGISPAVSEKAFVTVRKILSVIPSNIKISIDLNYRSKLWKWIRKKGLSVPSIMRNICKHAYFIAGNELDFHNALGMGTGKEKTIDSYKRVALQCFEYFHNLKYIAVSLRESITASENNWSGLLFVSKKGKIATFKGPEFKINNIIDRVGTGDSFTAGVIHGIINYGKTPQHIINFAVGLSALNHTVRGDASQFTVEDVERVLQDPSGKIIR